MSKLKNAIKNGLLKSWQKAQEPHTKKHQEETKIR
jgi:hypothetical protein